MAFLDEAGLGAKAFYGPRGTVEGLAGHVGRQGATKEMVIEFSGENINDGIMDSIETIPANALIVAAYVDVETAVTMTGTSPTVLIGTNGSEVTNGLVISEAQAEAASVYDVTSTLTGTWAAGLTSDTAVSVTLGGTTPTITDDGRIKVVIEYVQVTA